MKRFIKKLFAFLFVPILLLLILSFIIPRRYYQSFEYGLWENVFKNIDKIPRGTKNFIIGDSRSQYGLNAKYINAINFSLGGATPVESFYILTKILKKNKIDTLYISFGQFHLFHQDCFYFRTVYYNFFDKDYLLQVLKLSEEINDENYLLNKQIHLSIIYKKLLLNNHYLFGLYPIIQNTKDFLKYGLKNIIFNLETGVFQGTQFKLGYENAGENRELSESYILEDSKEQEFENLFHSHSQVNELYLQKIIELCKKKKIQYHFMVFPLPEKIIKPNSNYFKKYNGLLTQKSENPIIFPFFTLPNNLFRDPSHLNKKGVELYSKTIREMLYKKN